MPTSSSLGCCIFGLWCVRAQAGDVATPWAPSNGPVIPSSPTVLRRPNPPRTSTFPEKVTLATPEPAAAQLFVEKHFGLLRRYLNFEGEDEKGCAIVRWNTICQAKDELEHNYGKALNDIGYSWEWNVILTPSPPRYMFFSFVYV